jgi:hypothetical protein
MLNFRKGRLSVVRKGNRPEPDPAEILRVQEEVGDPVLVADGLRDVAEEDQPHQQEHVVLLQVKEQQLDREEIQDPADPAAECGGVQHRVHVKYTREAAAVL